MNNYQPIGFMEVPIPYSQIEDIYSVSRWDSSQKFYIRIVICDGSVLLQVKCSIIHMPISEFVNFGDFDSEKSKINCNPIYFLYSYQTNGSEINGSIQSTGR